MLSTYYMILQSHLYCLKLNLSNLSSYELKKIIMKTSGEQKLFFVIKYNKENSLYKLFL